MARIAVYGALTALALIMIGSLVAIGISHL